MSKRLLYLSIFILASVSSLAQERLIYTNQIFPESLTEQTVYLKNTIPSIQNKAFEIQQRLFKQSKYSKHYTFDILYNGLPIFTNFIKVNTDTKNKILSLANGTGNFDLLDETEIARQNEQWKTLKPTGSIWPDEQIVRKKYFAIFEQKHTAEVIEVQEAWDKTYDKTKLRNLKNQVVAEWSHERKLGIDTVVNINIFSPDPLTFLGKTYGTPYLDLNDQDQGWMATAYILAQVPALFDTAINQFVLENKFIKMMDLQAPTNVVPSSANPNLYFNRSEAGFEDGMVAYHISKMHDHLAALGFDSLMNVQLEADAHGQFGADNSIFNRNGGAPTIIFGDGGVDDAEDADVIIHEYSHGISWSANDNTFFGNERPALDEGIADYFATSYSRGLSNYRWEDMFSWDGHNEYWGGRTATTSAQYSVPFSGNLYALGEVWNAAMQNIFTDLGREKTDALMLETLYFLTDSSTLPHAAQYMLQADTLLHGGENTLLLCKHFSDKKISLPCQEDTSAEDNNFFYVSNSIGFSQGTAPVLINLGHTEAATLLMFDMNGRRILNEKIANGTATIDPKPLAAGVYIVKIISTIDTHTIKLNRF